MFNVAKIREDFPILNKTVNNKPLVYLDNAATSQTPKQVIDTISEYYFNYNANIHRGVHSLSQQATDAYEKARKIIQEHFNIKSANEVIFTSGTTHGINIIANGFKDVLNPEDEIIISGLEHHSNIVPWQMLCDITQSKIRVIPILEDGSLDINTFDTLLNKNTKLIIVNHISNALGVINPIEYMIQKARETRAAILVDGAQSCSHIKPDLQKLDVDFYVTSAHKMCGPTGIGMLYGKKYWLDKLPPYQGGGEMIDTVTFQKTTYAGLPHKFEAGTPNISGGIAFGAAVSYLNNIGFDNIESYEQSLLQYATQELLKIEGLQIYGNTKSKTAVISFNIKGLHAYDIGSILDQMGIAIRTGHHCTQPIMDKFKIAGTARASFSFYNTMEEVDRLVTAVKKAKQMLS